MTILCIRAYKRKKSPLSLNGIRTWADSRGIEGLIPMHPSWNFIRMMLVVNYRTASLKPCMVLHHIYCWWKPVRLAVSDLDLAVHEEILPFRLFGSNRILTLWPWKTGEYVFKGQVVCEATATTVYVCGIIKNVAFRWKTQIQGVLI